MRGAAPAMKPAAKAKAAAMKSGASALSKSGLADAIAKSSELAIKDVKKMLDSLAEVGAKEVKTNSKLTIPGLVMIKTRVKPATKAGTRNVFGKEVKVKAKPASTVVKAFCVAALKKSI